MTPDELNILYQLLLKWKQEDYGNLPGFKKGYWTRGALSLMMEDVFQKMKEKMDAS